MLGKKIPLFSKLRTENKPFSIAHAPILTQTVHPRLQNKHLYTYMIGEHRSSWTAADDDEDIRGQHTHYVQQLSHTC